MNPNLKRVLWVVSGDAGARLVGFAVTAYLARVLGPSGFGLINLGLAILAYLSQLSGAGLQVLETRNVAKMGVVGEERVGTVLAFRLVLALALSGLTGLIVGVFSTEGETGEVIWLSTLILIPLAISLDWFFQGREKFGPLSVAKVIVAVAYGLLAFLFVKGPEDYEAAILALALGTLAGALFLLIWFRRSSGALRLSVSFQAWGDIAGKSASVGLALLAGQSAVNLGPIVLAYWFGNQEAGIFSAAMKLVLVVLLLDRVLNSILLPLLARIRRTRPEEFAETVSLIFKGVFTVVFPVAVWCGVLAPWLVAFVFGDGYTDAVAHLRFLLMYVVLTLLNSVMMCSMLAVGEELRYSRIVLTGSTVLAGLVFALTAILGPVGAGLGVGLGEMVMFGTLLWSAKRTLRIDLSRATTRFFLVAVVTLGAITVLPVSQPVGLIPLSAAVFVLALFLLGGVTLRDLRTLIGKLV